MTEVTWGEGNIYIWNAIFIDEETILEMVRNTTTIASFNVNYDGPLGIDAITNIEFTINPGGITGHMAIDYTPIYAIRDMLISMGPRFEISVVEYHEGNNYFYRTSGNEHYNKED